MSLKCLTQPGRGLIPRHRLFHAVLFSMAACWLGSIGCFCAEALAQGIEGPVKSRLRASRIQAAQVAVIPDFSKAGVSEAVAKRLGVSGQPVLYVSFTLPREPEADQVSRITKICEIGHMADTYQKAGLAAVVMDVKEEKGGPLALVSVDMQSIGAYQKKRDLNAFMEAWRVIKMSRSFLPGMSAKMRW